MPVIKNYEKVRGDTLYFLIKILDSNGQPQNLNNYKIFFTMKPSLNLNDDDPSVIKIDEEITGDVTEYLLQVDTSNVEAKTYYYDIQIKTALGQVMTILMGQIKFIPDVTLRTE